jgi:hypothetical protein
MCVCAQATPMPPNGTGMELLPWPIPPIAACSEFYWTIRSNVALLILSIASSTLVGCHSIAAPPKSEVSLWREFPIPCMYF